MLRGRRLVVIALTISLLWALHGPSAAENELAKPHAFDDGLQLVRAELDAGNCEKGMADLKVLLKAHEDANYARARSEEVQELMRSLACGTKFKRPKAKDLVCGDLQKWSPDSGKIRIKYTPKTCKDFEKRGGLFYFPALLTGPFTLEIKGKSYPSKEKEIPRIVLGGSQHPDTGKDQTWTIDFSPPRTSKGKKKLVFANFVYANGLEEETISKKSATAKKKGKPYKLVMKCARTRIAVTLNSRNMGTAKKDKRVYGYLSFRAGGWTEAKLTGQVDPAWIQGRLDEILRKQLADFESAYDPEEHLPEWLFDPPRESRSRQPEVDVLAKLDDKFYDDFLAITNDARMDEYDSALDRIGKIQKRGAPEAACEFLRAQTRKRMTQLEKALAHVQRTVELEPAYLDAVLMQGSLLRELGRFEQAAEAFVKATEHHAAFPQAYERAAEEMLMAGRPSDAKRITQLAARNGITSKSLRKLNKALAKAVNGPRWPRRFSHKSRNYHVMSDMDQNTCAEAAKQLEQAFEAFRERLGWVPRDETRLFKVFIFKDREGFIGYQADLKDFMGKPMERAAGLYTGLLKQLLIWDHGRREDMMRTVRHEGFHQYLDRLMPSPPVWFNEGLAEYHEIAINEGGKLTFGHLHRYHVQVLKSRGLVPLEKFLYIAPGAFYERPSINYGQAWLLVHMLQHEKGYASIFKQLVEDLKSGSAYEVVRKTFPPERLPKLDKDLEAYLDKLAD